MISLAALAMLGTAGTPYATRSEQSDAHAGDRAAMVEIIRAHARLTVSYAPGLAPQISEAVLDAMARVPRHEFVPERVRDLAYEDRPLPIGYGQTISQPYIVALMTDLLRPRAGDRVLEVGTGSGYQAAVLAELGLDVATIEIVPELGRTAKARLGRLGYDVRTKIGDGYHGWDEHAPFDGLLVTAAASHIPPPLVRQLKPGGRMVVPVGPPFMVQQLVLVTKDHDGSVRTRQLLPVRFVPLTGEH